MTHHESASSPTIVIRRLASAVAAVMVSLNGEVVFAQCDPALTGTFDEPVSCVAISGSLAYMTATGDGFGLRIVDVSVPTAPDLVGSMDLPGGTNFGATGLALAGTTAFVTDLDSAFYIIDVSDSTGPAVFGTVEIPGLCWDVAVSGELAFVTSSILVPSDPLPYFLVQLHVIDVSVPRQPVILSVLTPPELWRYGFFSHVAVSNNLVIITCDRGMSILDVTDPAAPEWRGTWFTEHGASVVEVSGEVAYVSGNGLVAIDISNPWLPTVLGFAGGGSSQDPAQALALSESTAYFAHDQGLQIIDISDPTNMTVIGGLGLADRGLKDGVFEINVSDGSVYLPGPSLAIWDVSTCDGTCTADVDGDADVGVGDLLTVLGGWDTDTGDVTGDGTTDVADVLAVLAEWGPCV